MALVTTDLVVLNHDLDPLLSVLGSRDSPVVIDSIVGEHPTTPGFLFVGVVADRPSLVSHGSLQLLFPSVFLLLFLDLPLVFVEKSLIGLQVLLLPQLYTLLLSYSLSTRLLFRMAFCCIVPISAFFLSCRFLWSLIYSCLSLSMTFSSLARSLYNIY